MKKVLNLLLSAAMVFGLTACAGEEAPTSSSTSESTGAAETTVPATAEEVADKDTSSMTIAIAMQFDTLDPALSTTVYNAYVIGSIYSNLLELDDNAKPAPCLAESYEVSEDGLTWTFHLRDGIVFSDGTPITSENFAFAMKRLLSYGNENSFRASTWTQFIKGAAEYRENAMKEGSSFDCLTADASGLGVECPDEKTYVLHLNYPVAYLDVNLAGGGSSSPLPLDTPQHDSTWSITPGYATNGRYTLAEFSLNDKAVVKKSDSYWNKDAVVMQELVWQVMADPSAQEAAFKTGDIDVALSVSVDTLNSYAGTPNLWNLMYPAAYILAVNGGPKGPEYLKNENVRKALYMSINKEAIVNVIGDTDRYPTISGYVAYGLPGASGDFAEEREAEPDKMTFNPEKAAELLNAEGYTEENPLHINYKYSMNSIHGDVATMLQSMWKVIGDTDGDGQGCITVDFDATEGGVYYSQIDDGQIEIGRYGMQVSDSPMTFLKDWTTAQRVCQFMTDDLQAEYDAMIQDAAYTVDPVEFANKLHAAEHWLIEEHCILFPLFQFASSALVQENVHGNQLKITTLDFSKCYKD